MDKQEDQKSQNETDQNDTPMVSTSSTFDWKTRIKNMDKDKDSKKEIGHQYTPSSPWRQVMSDSEEESATTENTESDSLEQRPHWNMRIDFYIVAMAATLGMGNVLSLPAAVLRYGRGAFILVYSFVSVVVGISLLYLEISWGQLSSRGPIEAYNISPLFKGVGIASVIISCYNSLIYPISFVYTGCYIFSGDSNNIYTCQNSWNTKACVEIAPEECNHSPNATRYPNGTCYNNNNFYLGVWNLTAYEISRNITVVTAGFEYLRYNIQRSYNLTGNTTYQVNSTLFLGLVCFWFVSFLMLYSGVRSLCKVMAFPVLAPQLILLYTLLRGSAVTNSNPLGDYFLTIPTWSIFLQSEMYFKVFERVMYSLGIGYGALITLSSYNKQNKSVLKPSIMIVIINLWTSFLMGMTVFSFIGHFDEDLISRLGEGETLVFELYALSATNLSKGPLLTTTFFVAITLMGLGSFVATEEVTLTAIGDNWPNPEIPSYLIVGTVCILSCMIGTPFVTKGGYYLKVFAESYIPSYAPFIVTFFNVFVILGVYGHKRYYSHFETMSERRPLKFLKYAWFCVLCVLPVVLLWHKITIWVSDPTPSADEEISQRMYGGVLGQMIGWIITATPFLCIPLAMIVQILRGPKHETFCKRAKALMSPSPQWTSDISQSLSVDKDHKDVTNLGVHPPALMSPSPQWTSDRSQSQSVDKDHKDVTNVGGHPPVQYRTTVGLRQSCDSLSELPHGIINMAMSKSSEHNDKKLKKVSLSLPPEH